MTLNNIQKLFRNFAQPLSQPRSGEQDCLPQEKNLIQLIFLGNL